MCGGLPVPSQNPNWSQSVPVSIEHARIRKRISKMTPQPQPVHEIPFPKPNRSCSQSKSQLRNANLSKPDKQPDLSRIFSSFTGRQLTFGNVKSRLLGGSGVRPSPFITLAGLEQPKSPPIAKSGAAGVSRVSHTSRRTPHQSLQATELEPLCFLVLL